MGEHASAEKTPIPKEIYNWRVYACACAAAMASVGIGYDSAFIGTSITNASFKKEFGLTDLSVSEYNLIASNIVSIFQAGSFFGAFAGYPAGWYLGRRYGLALAGLIFLVGSVLTVVANSKTGLGVLYAGRVILGFGIGIAANLTPIYIAEIAPAVIRGRLIGFHECGWQVGTVVGFFINYGVALHVPPGNQQWIIPFAVQLVPAGLLTIVIPFVYESPRWLANQDRTEDALRCLSRLRHLPIDHPYVQEEYAEMADALAADRANSGGGVLGPVKTLFSHRYLVSRLALAISMFIWQNGTGINAINYYSPTVFKSIGIAGTNTGLLSTGIFGVVKFAMAFVWIIFLIDRFGRRIVLMVGAAGGGISMFYIGAYIKIADPVRNPTSSLTPGGTSALAFFYIWVIFFGSTWNGTPWVYGAEIFPQHVRVASQAFVAASNFLFAFAITRATPYMFTAMGYGVFMLFASMMLLSIPYVFFFVPETSHIKLERMDELFATKPVWRAKAIILAKADQHPLNNDASAVMTSEDQKDGVYYHVEHQALP